MDFCNKAIEGQAPPKAKADEASDLILVPEGTPVDVVPEISISSETATVGETLAFTAAENVIIDGYIVIERGAPVRGTVVEAESSGKRGKAGKLRIEINTVTAVDKRKIRVRGMRGDAGEDRTAKSIALAAQGNIFYGWVRGDKAQIPAGTILTVYTDEDKEIKGIKRKR